MTVGDVPPASVQSNAYTAKIGDVAIEMISLICWPFCRDHRPIGIGDQFVPSRLPNSATSSTLGPPVALTCNDQLVQVQGMISEEPVAGADVAAFRDVKGIIDW